MVIVKPESIEKSKNGMITGIIYFDFEDFQFPDKQWNDFVVIVLLWWSEATLRLSNNISEIDYLKFMDGALQVRLTKQDRHLFFVECMDRNKGGNVEYSKSIPIDQLTASVKKAGMLVNCICNTNKWFSDDISQLGKLTKDL